MTVFSAASCIVTFIALCIDLGFWTYVRNKIRDQGVHAELSNCIWITLVAFAILLVGCMFDACGTVGACFGTLRRRRSGY